MRNTKKRGISPVIATVILVAIAIVISIAAAFWMTGLLTSFTSYERVQVVSSYATRSGDTYTVCVNMTNIGATNVTITNILVNDKPYNTYSGASIKVAVYYDSTSTWYDTLPCSFGPGTRCNIQISGFTTSNFKPGSTIKVSILTASGITYDRTITLP
jgi:flagellin-like protein